MNTLTKGELTQLEILEKVNELFNRSGVDHTILEISDSIGMGKSRITNYFPKKEDLIIGLLRQYEKEMAVWVTNYLSSSEIQGFYQYLPYLAGIMKLMFRYRRVISYSLIHPGLESSVDHHIRLNYDKNKIQIRGRMETFIKNGLLKEKLLEPDTFEVFILQFLCVSSNWIVMFNLLEADKSFDSVKERYLRTILSCLYPYLTENGEEQMKAAIGLMGGNDL